MTHTLGRFWKRTGAVGLHSLRWLQYLNCIHAKLGRDSDSSFLYNIRWHTLVYCSEKIPVFLSSQHHRALDWFIFWLVISVLSFISLSSSPLCSSSFRLCTGFVALPVLAMYLQAGTAPRWTYVNIACLFRQDGGMWLSQHWWQVCVSCILMDSLEERAVYVTTLYEEWFALISDSTFIPLDTQRWSHPFAT